MTSAFRVAVIFAEGETVGHLREISDRDEAARVARASPFADGCLGIGG
jgi:hypothetical protein